MESKNHTKYLADARFMKPFAPTATESICHGTERVKIKPNDQIVASNKSYTFEFPSTGEEYINLKSVNLLFKGTIKKGNANIAANDKIAIANNFLHSIWSNIEVEIGQSQKRISNTDYAYVGLMQTMDKITKLDTKLLMQGFVADEGDTLTVSDQDKDRNLYTRMLLTRNSSSVTFMGELFSDIFRIDGFLPHKTPITITLTKNRPEFFLQSENSNETNSYDFIIEDIELHLDIAKVDPYLSSALNSQLEKREASYPIEQLSIKKFDVNSGSYSTNISKIWNGKLPRRFAFALISQKAYAGSYGTDPLSFESGNLKTIKLSINKKEFLSIDVENNSFANFYRLLQFLQVGHLSVVTPSVFNHSLPVYCIDLNTLCQKSESCITELSPSGLLDCELTFKQAPSSNLHLLLFAYTTSEITVNSRRIVNTFDNIG